jgi:NYN domain
MAVDEESQPPALRAAMYVDGFNLYYPIHEMGPDWCYLKWASLWKLADLIAAPHNAAVKKVVLCTAVPGHYPDKRDRHNTFNNAQRANGVTVILGHHMHDGEKWNEKQTDINVALALMTDAFDDLYDMAILISADSDQGSTARFFSERFPDKKLLAVAPPDRKVPDKVKPYAFQSFSMNRNLMDLAVMRETVQGKSGLIVRPPSYAPPAGWMHPDDRPKGKPPKAPKGL